MVGPTIIWGVIFLVVLAIALAVRRPTTMPPTPKVEVGQCTVAVIFDDGSEYRERFHGDALWMPTIGTFTTTALEKARNFINNQAPIHIGTNAPWVSGTIFVPRHLVARYVIENEASFEVTASRL